MFLGLISKTLGHVKRESHTESMHFKVKT